MMSLNKRRKAFAFAVLAALLLAVLPAQTALGATYRAEFGAQFDPGVNADVGEWPDLAEYAVEFEPGAETTLTISFDAPVKLGANYAAVNTSFPAEGVGEIQSFTLDGNPVELGAVFLNNEGIDGGLRLTICNKWNSDITEQPVDVAELPEFSTLEIVFTVNEGSAGGGAYRAEFGAQFDPGVNADVGEWPDLAGYGVDFEPGVDTTLTINFDAPVKFGENYAALNTSFPAEGVGEIRSFTLDGNAVELGAIFLNNEGIDGGLRLTICNKWNSDITEQPVDVAALPEFSTLEIVFCVNEGDGSTGAEEEEPTPAEGNPNIPAFDPNGTYHGYLGVQSQNYTFRNAWADAAYGAEGEEWGKIDIGNNFNGLTGWDESSNAVVRDGVFTDVEIAGNGTYRVELTDFDFGEDETFNLLFLSTDIPMQDNPLSFTNVKVQMNGSTKYTFDQAFVNGIDNNDARDYYEIACINIWNADLGSADGLFGYVMPTNSIALEFTVSGFAYDKAEESPEPTEAPAASTPDSSADSGDEEGGNGGLIIGIIIGALVVAAGVIVLVMKAKGGKK